jgi:hypothetical protein
MKKQLLILAAFLCFFSAASAQSVADAPDFQYEALSEEELPTFEYSNNWEVGTNLLHYFTPNQGGAYIFVKRHFNDKNSALRARIYNSNINQNARLIGNKNRQGNTNSIGVRAGIEWHQTTNRVQFFYGADAIFENGAASDKLTGADGATLGSSSSNVKTAGAVGIVGFRYSVTRNIAVGLEGNIGGSYTQTSKTEVSEQASATTTSKGKANVIMNPFSMLTVSFSF